MSSPPEPDSHAPLADAESEADALRLTGGDRALWRDLAAGLSAPQRRRLGEWWHRDGAGAPLADFLHKAGYLADGAAQALQLAARGFLPERPAGEACPPATLARLAERLNAVADAAAAGPAPPAVGDCWGRYLLVNRTGRGASSEVFQAVHLHLQRTVALKIPLSVRPGDRDRYREVFRAEARVMASIDDPHVVRVHDFDEHDDWPFLVMEFVEGVTLEDVLRQSGKLRWDSALRVVRQAALGLRALDRAGLVHRDVKPANILVARDGTVKLADLGLALVRADAEGDAAAIVGTAAYMAPEQATDHTAVDARADIYGLGATLYHMLTGQPPFPSRVAAEVLRRHREEEPTPVEYLAPEVPDAVLVLARRMLGKRPDQRYRSWDELLDHFRRIESRLTQPASQLPLTGDGPAYG